MGWNKSKPRETRRIPDRKKGNNNSPSERLMDEELKLKNRSDSTVQLQKEIQGIRPRFDSVKEPAPKLNKKKSKTERVKKMKDPNKRYRHVYNRVYYERKGSQSSYSSLQSDWETIKDSVHLGK